jgi:Coenzyme PQQ synthesis protein D (PqqD)
LVSRSGRTHPAGPDRTHLDRPAWSPGVDTVESDDGLMVRRAGSSGTRHLNDVAAVVVALCDGRRTVADIAEVIAEKLGLAAAPTVEVSACVQTLRRAGILQEMALPPSDGVTTVDGSRS